MPPLKSLPETIYARREDGEFNELMGDFKAGRYELFRADTLDGDDSVYFFSPAGKYDDYQAPLMHGMMEGVVSGAVTGEYYGDYETFAQIGENGQSTKPGGDVHYEFEPEKKSSRIAKLLSRLRG